MIAEYKYIEPFNISREIGDFIGAYIISEDKYSFLLNSENGCSIMLDLDLVNQIISRNISEPFALRLIQRGLISNENSMPPLVNECIQPTFFIFDLTQACNFRCVYCFRHLEDKVTTITDDNLDAITSYIINYCKKYHIKDFCIQPWGGEPLIAFEKIKRMDDTFKAADLHPLISIETNASLITEDLAKEASERNIRLGISIDGYSEIQNIHRPLMSGAPSFDKMRRGVDIISQFDNLKQYGVVCVLTSRSFPFLADIIEFFGTELKVRCFKLNLIKDNPVMEDAQLCLNDEQIIEAQNILIDKLIDLNQRGFEITELNVQEKLMNLLVRSKSNICTSRGCMGGAKMIAFDQNGCIYPCDVTDYKDESIGDVHTGGDLIELVKTAKKQGRDFFTKKHSDDCDKCPFWFFCKGGCTTAIKYKLGKVEGVDHQECLANLSLYPRLINIILTNPKAVSGLTRHHVKMIEE
ncbi:MAG: radical SAM protein [Alistipes sp.]